MNSIRRIAVLGAGTMGSRIAGQFSNAGVPVLLLDLTPEAARAGLDSCARGKPPGLYTDAAKNLIVTGGFEKDLPEIKDCDWVIEAVTENLDAKRSLWSKVDSLRNPEAVLSTNTSGIPLEAISGGFPSSFRKQFLGTHFFNPPRYLHLCEVIPGAETAPGIVAGVTDYCDRRLGKGVVECKDTPNFIANRIGSFFGGTVYKYTMEDDFTVEEVDALTGSLIGLPNSASFRLLDIVGIDIWVHVAENLYRAVPDDPWRNRFPPPPFVGELIARKWLGEKTGQGFFKRVGPEREIHAIDWKTLEYHPAVKPKFPAAEAVKSIEDTGSRLRALLAGSGRVEVFLWKILRDVMLYSASRVPEISDRVVEIDRAMRWGYAHTFGPFELWDELGFEATARRMQSDGFALPVDIERMLSRGAKGFYRSADQNGEPATEYFDLATASYAPLEPPPGTLRLRDIKRARGIIAKNAGCSLIDLRDGALCLEFHSKLNTLGEDQIGMIFSAIEETEKNHRALIIGNQGELFSAGANLMLVLMAAQDAEWDELGAAVHRFQQANLAIKYAPVPVVAAPHARAFGGGCEIVLHAARVQASAELYMGLVETAVGLIPGAGGCKELIAKLKDPRRVFELIGYAKVSGSADHAKELGLLDRGAAISMNQDRLLADAKAVALAMAPSYRPPSNLSIRVAGEAGIALLKIVAWTAHQGGYISEHDLLIAGKLAHVLCGGALKGEQLVTEQYLLDLEREAFLSLCGQIRTQERMQHMLKTGKPLRN